MTDGIMAEWIELAEAKLRKRLSTLPPGERAHFDQAVAELRHMGAEDGVTEWNEDHLVGFLFATMVLRSGVRHAHDAKQVSHGAMLAIEELVEFDEGYLIAMVRGI